jgi:hypothetical protein
VKPETPEAVILGGFSGCYATYVWKTPKTAIEGLLRGKRSNDTAEGIPAAPEGGISYNRGYFSWGLWRRKTLFALSLCAIQII